MPESYLIYDSPYIIIPPLVALGYGYKKESNALMIPLFWLAVVAALEGYAIFGNSVLSIMLANRALNFLHPAIAILTSAGLYRLYKMGKKPLPKKLLKISIATTMAFIVILNIYSLYAAISLEERYLGYACLYRKQEYIASNWVATYGNQLTIAGDWKISRILQDYFRLKTDPIQALLYLNGKTESQPQILFVYSQMIQNGYLISYQVIDLPENWMEKTAQLNQIYSNGLASLYAGEKS